LESSKDVFVSLNQLVHVALAGSTRQGKTSIMRQMMAQLCSIGCQCVLLDPHYTPYDVERDEDWTPFSPLLSVDPMQSRDYDAIEEILKNAATTILDARKERRAQSRSVGKDAFFFIDEYPAIVAKRPGVQEHVACLLREGGKYKLHLVIASQDFQVKTISPQSGGAIRENFSTCLYVGGDPTTAKVLLDYGIPRNVEASLGKGSIYLRCETCKEASPARTLWTDNEALYTLLGPSSYVPSAPDEGEFGDLPDIPTVELGSGRPFRLVRHDAQERPTESTGRFTSTLSQELQQALTAYNDGATTSRALASALDIGKTKASELLRQLKAGRKIS